MPSPLPEIAVVALGGTIASVPNASGRDAVPKLSAADLFEAIPQTRSLANLSAQAFRQYASGDLTAEDIVELAGLIQTKADEGADGIVITQGTDTLEETSFLLDLLVTTAVPVVLTGAMRNPGLAGADGPANVLGALRVALSPDARGLGPLVVFSDEIHLARFVRKNHSASISAFHSPNAGPIGWISEDRVRIPLVPRQRTSPVLGTQNNGTRLPRVALVKLSLGIDSSAIDLVVNGGYDGLVLETFGGGHVPGSLMPSLAEASRRLPVVFATRTGAGEVYQSTYGFTGSEVDLLANGLLGAGALDGLKARLLLMLLIGAGATRDEIRQRFLESSL